MDQITNLSPIQLLKASEVAEKLNISKAFVYKLMNQGVLPSVKIGYSKRVRQEDLQRFIRENHTGYQVDI